MISDHIVSSITTNCKKKREDPKKDHLHDINGMSSCSSMRKIEGKNNKLIIAAKTSRKCNITTYGYRKCILFLFETQTFLQWNTPWDSKIISQEFKIEDDKLFSFVCFFVCFFFLFCCVLFIVIIITIIIIIII